MTRVEEVLIEIEDFLNERGAAANQDLLSLNVYIRSKCGDKVLKLLLLYDAETIMKLLGGFKFMLRLSPRKSFSIMSLNDIMGVNFGFNYSESEKKICYSMKKGFKKTRAIVEAFINAANNEA